MSIPGFTAEISLDKTSKQYRTERLPDQVGVAIYPAVGPEPDVDTKCFWDCYEDCIGPCTKDCKEHGGD